MIKKQIKIFITSLATAYILCTLLLSVEIVKRQNTSTNSYYLSGNYYLESEYVLDGTVKLALNDKNKDYSVSIGRVGKIAEISGNYIGYLEEDGSIDVDKRYFYIGRSTDFELTKSEAEEKLKKDVGEELKNVEIVYNNPAGYVYRENGKIGYLKGDFKYLMKVFVMLLTAFTVLIIIILNKTEIIKRKIKNFFKLLLMFCKEKNSVWKKTAKVLFLILVFLHALNFFMSLDLFRTKFLPENFSIGLNEEYHIKIENGLDETIDKLSLYKNEIKICDSITKLDKKGTYYIGYLESHKGEKECNSYFYINSVKKEDIKFGLTEKNMGDKFKETDFKHPVGYYAIKYNGNGGGKDYISERDFRSSILFFIPGSFIVLLMIAIFVFDFTVYGINKRKEIG